MNQLVLASALAAIILPVTPALAEPHGNDRRAYASEYDRYGHYNQPRPLTQTDEVWRGPDGHYHWLVARSTDAATARLAQCLAPSAAGCLAARSTAADRAVVDNGHCWITVMQGAACSRLGGAP